MGTNYKKKYLGVLMVIVMLVTSIAIPLMGVSAATTFPYNAAYPYGKSTLTDIQDPTDMLKAAWNEWKSNRITSNGAGGYRRVQRDSSTSFDTVSEGIGYGMILSVYFDEQALFDDLYRYGKAHFNGNGLMGWHEDSNGNFTTSDYGSSAATDADEDMAISLVFADKKWGSGSSVNYGSEARNLINNIFNKEVEGGSILKPGDGWGGFTTTNPSYFAPAWYRVFASFTGNSGWNTVANKCYEILNSCKRNSSSTGLIPDWCKGDGTQASGQGYDFKYDAIRTPWRIAIDYSWYGTANAKTVCDDMTKYFSGLGAANIKDGYTLSGNIISNNHTSTFVSCIAAGAMTSTDSAFSKSIYDECIKVYNPSEYYGNCLRMMSLLFTTGNFPNLYDYTPVAKPTPTVTPTVTPTATPTSTPTTYISPTPTATNQGGGEYEFQVNTTFSASRLVANQMITAKVQATNVSSNYYSGTKDVLLIVALYDSNNTMQNVSYISKGIAYKGTESLSAGFKLPANVNGMSVKAFMWDGDDMRTTNMIPLSNVTQLQ